MQVCNIVDSMHRVNVMLHEIFQALSDPCRIRIVRLMIDSKSEICLCELSESFAEPEYKLSRHIKILKSSGIISSVRDGKWIYHSLVADKLYLKSILKAIGLFPDTNKQAASDLANFRRRLTLRDNGRCKTQVRTTEQRLRKKN